MGGDARGGQAIFPQHSANGVKTVKRRRVEGGAHEAHRVARIADDAGRRVKVVEFRIPAGDRRPLAETGRRVEEAQPSPAIAYL